MKKLLTVSLILFFNWTIIYAEDSCGSCHERARAGTYKIDSTICQTWSNGIWKNSTNTNYTYDQDGNLISEITKKWHPNNFWKNYESKTYSYNLNGNKTEWVVKYFDENYNYWKNSSRWTYIYDLSGNLTTITKEIGDGNNLLSWINSNKNTYVYDANNNLTMEIIENWGGNIWRNHKRTTNTYNSGNLKISSLVENGSSNSWTYYERHSCIYDNSNNLIELQVERWNGTTWTIYSKNLYTYNATNKLISEIVQYWSNPNWVNYYRTIYTYDANGNMLTNTRENWNFNQNLWTKVFERIRTYDLTNNMLTMQEFNPALTPDWVLYTYTYDNNNNQLGSIIEVSYDGIAWELSGKCDNDLLDCGAHFMLYPDNITPHLWYALNLSYGTAPITYTWNWGDGTTTIGLNTSHTYNTADYYNICLTISDAAGCSNTFCDSSTYIYKSEAAIITINVVQNLPTGLENIDVNDFNIFPNPTNDILNLSKNKSSIMQYKIVNLLGELIIENNAQGKLISIDISNLQQGVYFILLQDEFGQSKKKFVVK